MGICIMSEKDQNIIQQIKTNLQLLYSERNNANTFKDKLKSKASLLIVGPIIHVSKNNFSIEVEMAKKAGFDVIDSPKVSISNAVILMKR